VSYTDLEPLNGTIAALCASLFALLALVTTWQVFTKAKRAGWAALIPIYNIYILLKITRRPSWWLILYFIPLVNIVVHAILSIDVAKAFGKHAGFGFWLLWAFPFIGYPALAFGPATYTGRKKIPKSRSKLRTGKKHVALITIVSLLLAASFGVVTLAAYYRYENHKVRSEITTETTKYQHLSFDTLDEWNDDYRMTVMYPKTDNVRINTAVHTKIDQYVTDFRRQVAEKPAGSKPYYLHVVGSVNLASDRVINFLFDGTWTINNMPGNITVNALFDRTTGAEVQASQLFKDSEYLNIASDTARKALPGILKDNYNQARVEQGTAPQTANFDQYEIADDKTINIIFEPGQVASPALGTVKVPLSLDSLSAQWNRDEVNKLFPDFIAALQAKEEAARKAAEAEAAAKAAAAAAAQSRQVGSYLPAHGNVDCSKAKCIALSFDDGPGAGTNTILDTLEQYHVPATFMVVGTQVASHAAELRREAANGNDIGNHTWDHADLTTLSVAGIQSEVNRTQTAIMSVLGKQPFMVRPPYGAYNQVVLQTLNMPLILWSIDPDDWKDRDADIVYQRVMSHAKPGAIIISHDLYPTTAAAYARIIPDLISQGYTLVTVSNLMGINPANLTPRVYTGVY
jgi:peptidoglycan/xylan/chitin deacetylase (PgdA/CDA1 family)